MSAVRIEDGVPMYCEGDWLEQQEVLEATDFEANRLRRARQWLEKEIGPKRAGRLSDAEALRRYQK